MFWFLMILVAGLGAWYYFDEESFKKTFTNFYLWLVGAAAVGVEYVTGFFSNLNIF